MNKLWFSLTKIKSFSLLSQRIFPSCEHFDLVKNVSGFDTLIDIGANRGQFSLLMLQFHNLKSVWLFEPQSDLLNLFFIYAEKKFLNTSFHEENIALSDTEKTVNFNITQKTDCSSYYIPTSHSGRTSANHLKIKKTISINTCKLDNFFQAQPSLSFTNCFVKIDTQGSELDVIQGAKSFLAKHAIYVYVEVSNFEHYHQQCFYLDVLRMLQSIGFSELERYNNVGDMDYCDVLFVNNKIGI